MRKNTKVLLKFFLVIFVLFIGINFVHAEGDSCYSIDVIECGIGDSQIPAGVATITRNIYNVVKYGTPLLIIVFGIVDFFRATIAAKDDEMKSSSGRFIKKLIAGFIVLLMFVIVQFVFSLLVRSSSGDIDSDSITSCISCFLFDGNDCVEAFYDYCPEGDYTSEEDKKPSNACYRYSDKEACKSAGCNWKESRNPRCFSDTMQGGACYYCNDTGEYIWRSDGSKPNTACTDSVGWYVSNKTKDLCKKTIGKCYYCNDTGEYIWRSDGSKPNTACTDSIGWYVSNKTKDLCKKSG